MSSSTSPSLKYVVSVAAHVAKGSTAIDACCWRDGAETSRAARSSPILTSVIVWKR